ncbi:MAG: pyruvate dehydrogenase complex dihydrolipoamide acetyltransferase [Bacteroidia bacterium]|jgi:pyruvate dehydrogenase E2 component (dihydrolipoamide acetyltransferase)|nr:pyruvate dehydrogenase complex dihydrolipoamide acetyltransferase [Bacteroidia bacterium]
MAEIVRMPKMSDTMTEGVLVKWHKKVGDTVKSGELVAEVETDKATMEFESYQAGTLLYLGVEEGKAIPVDGILAIMGKPGEDFKDLLASAQKEDAAKAAPAAAAPAEPVAAAKPAAQVSASTVAAPPTPTISAPKVQEIVHSANGDERLKVSPLAKRLATEKGIDLGMLKGSGEHGRIVKRDIDWFKPGSFVQGSTLSAKAVTKESFEEVTVTQMRKTIARRLAESKFTAPHFYLTMDIDMDEVVRARESINQVTQVKISFNDFVVKAVATSLREHPAVNSAWLGDRIRYNHHIHIGVAVAVEDGLLVPVVRFADSKSLSQIAVEVKEFAKRAKDKKLQPQDWEGNTFTISNLGMFNIESFTAIINPPDACILAIGAIKQIPVVKNGMVQPGNVMKVTLSCDHRVVDGVVGSKFLNTFKALLENPIVMLGQGNI